MSVIEEKVIKLAEELYAQKIGPLEDVTEGEARLYAIQSLRDANIFYTEAEKMQHDSRSIPV
jgi:hypothetical protein